MVLGSDAVVSGEGLCSFPGKPGRPADKEAKQRSPPLKSYCMIDHENHPEDWKENKRRN